MIGRGGTDMRSKQLQPTRPRTWVLVFDTGDDPVPELERFAQQHGLRGAHFTGIGAFSDAKQAPA